MSNTEYAVALVAAGSRSFFVQARSADPTRLEVDLKAGERASLKAEADPANLAGVLVPPLLIARGYRFTLEQVPCPSDRDLATYGRIDVEYR